MNTRKTTGAATKSRKVCITEHNTGNVIMLKKEQVDKANKELQDVINQHPNQVHTSEKANDDAAVNTTTTAANGESTTTADTTTVNVIDDTAKGSDEESEKPQVWCSHTHVFLLSGCSSH